MIDLRRGDCLEVMPTLAVASIDLILSDLPYGKTRNKWDSVIPLDRLWAEYLRVSKPNAAIVLTASQPFTSALVISQLSLFKHEWIWIKNRGSNFANTVREPFKEHESVLVFSRGGWTYNKQMQDRAPGGASRRAYAFSKNISQDSNSYSPFMAGSAPGTRTELRLPSSWQKFNTEVGLHPTQKPVSLMEYLVKTYSNPGDVVLDNAMGSGTTGIACVNLGRKFIGIESDPECFATAKKRLEDQPFFAVA